MNAAILFGVFLLLMVAGVPLAIALGLSGFATIVYAQMGVMSVPTTVYGGIAKYPLLALPLFILAGSCSTAPAWRRAWSGSPPRSSGGGAAGSRPPRSSCV
jgi:TRAP-type mannitol/chloroaromatic compound transport system permease large subunit